MRQATPVAAPRAVVGCARSVSKKPGETITYELQATNWGINKVTTGKAISRIPYGTKLKNALADDGNLDRHMSPHFYDVLILFNETKLSNELKRHFIKV